MNKLNFDKPVVVGGFVGQTMVGIIATSYIISQLGMHQVGHLKSKLIPPVAVFVGGKLRHPFRIYSGNDGKLMVIQCEVPIKEENLYDVSESLIKWINKFSPAEICMLDGVPVSEPPTNRKTYIVAGPKRLNELIKKGVSAAESAVIFGIGGALLNECIISKLPALSLLTHVSSTLPDPDSVLTLIKSLNDMYDLKIKTDVLEMTVSKIHEEIDRVVKEYNESRNIPEMKKTPETMYG
ncbi:MAG: proteasome assembly chaperone family protein [Thermoplasmataceae archaeon]